MVQAIQASKIEEVGELVHPEELAKKPGKSVKNGEKQHYLTKWGGDRLFSEVSRNEENLSIMNLLTKTAITSGIVLSSISLSVVNANAVGISGLGDPITNPALTGGTVIDFDAGPTGDFSNITFGNVTFTGVDAPLTIGSDFIGQFNTRGVNSMYSRSISTDDLS